MNESNNYPTTKTILAADALLVAISDMDSTIHHLDGREPELAAIVNDLRATIADVRHQLVGVIPELRLIGYE